MKPPALLLAVLAAAGMSGCAPLDPVVKARKAQTVACQEQEPERPSMPTELLPADADVDQYVQAAEAELERREGYEGKLVAALRGCIAPIAPAAP